MQQKFLLNSLYPNKKPEIAQDADRTWVDGHYGNTGCEVFKQGVQMYKNERKMKKIWMIFDIEN